MEVQVINMYKVIPKENYYKSHASGTTYNLYCGRGGDSFLGNPFKTNAIEQHKEFFLKNQERQDKLLDLCKVKKLEGFTALNLTCFCKPKICHCDVIKEWLEEVLIEKSN